MGRVEGGNESEIIRLGGIGPACDSLKSKLRVVLRDGRDVRVALVRHEDDAGLQAMDLVRLALGDDQEATRHQRLARALVARHVNKSLANCARRFAYISFPVIGRIHHGAGGHFSGRVRRSGAKPWCLGS